MSSAKRHPPAADIDALIAQVAQRNRVLLDPDDPIMVLATMVNQTLNDAVRRLNEATDAANAKSMSAAGMQVEAAKEVAERIVTASGPWIADQVRAAMKTGTADLIAELRAERRAAEVARKWSTRAAWVTAGLTTATAGALAGGWAVGLL